MWVRHRSLVIVPPEGDFEFWWDSDLCWCFIHVTIKLVLGMTRRSVIESKITHVSSSPREKVRREICCLVNLDRRKKIRRVCRLDSRCVFLSFSSTDRYLTHIRDSDTWTPPRCLYPRKESFVYFSESLRDSTIAFRVETFHVFLNHNEFH